MSEGLSTVVNAAPIETVIAAPMAAVWSALRDPLEIGRWYGWEHDDLAAEIDARFVSATESSATENPATESSATLLSLGGGGSLALTDEAGAGTRVIATGVSTGDLQQLRFLLERHPAGARRTVSTHDLTLPPSGRDLLDALGLPGTDAVVGEGFAVSGFDGLELSGIIWFRSPTMLAVTLDELHESLLVIDQASASAAHPRGRASLVLTTYAMTDEEFAAAEDTMISWWSGAR